MEALEFSSQYQSPNILIIPSEVEHHLHANQKVKVIVLMEEESAQKKFPNPGFLKGTFLMKPNFDVPLDDFKDYR